MTSIYTPFADGRTVRDIVEHTPALVNETWCRDLLRHTLDSLERQYATGAPHRPISPDTIVMLANNEPLLLPAPEEVGPAGAPTLAADLHALALVVHYAITAELPPDGPLGPRLYDNYSEALTNGLDRCLGPNQRLRPKTVQDMRFLLGIEAASEAEPVHASILPDAPAPVETTVPAAQEAPPLPDYGQPIPNPVTQEVRPVSAAPAVPVPAEARRPDAPEPEPEPEPEPAPRLHTPSATDTLAGAAALHAVPDRRADLPPAGSAAVDETPLLRTPAAASTEAVAAPSAKGEAAPARAPTALEAATAARLHEEAARKRTAPAAAPPRARTGSVQRWGWIAGAAVVLLAAGGALVSYLQQNNARDMVAVSLPPGERAANGLDAGETVVAPRTEGTAPAASGEPPVGAVTDPAASTLPGDAADAAAPEAGAFPETGALASGRAGEAVVNGTTYKLLIKPWGTVYVDGVDRGVSPPVKRLTLGRGKHTIRIVNPNFPEHVLDVNAGTRESTTIQHDFTAKAE